MTEFEILAGNAEGLKKLPGAACRDLATRHWHRLNASKLATRSTFTGPNCAAITN
jgi:hypothetical protein